MVLVLSSFLMFLLTIVDMIKITCLAIFGSIFPSISSYNRNLFLTSHAHLSEIANMKLNQKGIDEYKQQQTCSTHWELLDINATAEYFFQRYSCQIHNLLQTLFSSHTEVGSVEGRMYAFLTPYRIKIERLFSGGHNSNYYYHIF